MTFQVSKGWDCSVRWLKASTSEVTSRHCDPSIVTFGSCSNLGKDADRLLLPRSVDLSSVSKPAEAVSALSMLERGIHAAAGWHPPFAHHCNITNRSDRGTRSQAVLLMKWLFRINRNASLKSEMEKRVFTIPITTFAPALALIIAISFPLGAHYKAFLCGPTHASAFAHK